MLRPAEEAAERRYALKVSDLRVRESWKLPDGTTMWYVEVPAAWAPGHLGPVGHGRVWARLPKESEPGFEDLAARPWTGVGTKLELGDVEFPTDLADVPDGWEGWFEVVVESGPRRS